jgi:nitrate reductase (cytochrome)
MFRTVVPVSRRDFLKASAAASALAGLGIPGEVLAAGGERWVKSVCRYCGTGCGLHVGVRGGKVFAVKGDPDNHNRGLLCLKGFLLPQIMTARDPISRQPEFKICAVKIEKAGAA